SVITVPPIPTHFPYTTLFRSAVYEKEIEVIFHGKTWNYVALEAEVPNPGDYKRSYVGPTPVVVSRAEDGSINVFENRCAHRGARSEEHTSELQSRENLVCRLL